MKPDDALETYLSEAASWDADRVAMQRRSARQAWWVAGAGWICTMMLGLAIMLLMPLKRVEPFVIRVDNTTGLVDVVPVYVGNAPMPEAVTRYFLDHYVTVCERFNFSTAESDYQECGARLGPWQRRAPHGAVRTGLDRSGNHPLGPAVAQSRLLLIARLRREFAATRARG